jgi:hypothetical protein
MTSSICFSDWKYVGTVYFVDIIDDFLLYRNSIYNNVGCNKHLFVCFYFVFL